MNYCHTQNGPLHYLLHTIGAVLLAAACMAGGEWPEVAIIIAVSAMMILCGFMFASLTVRDEGDFLEIEYGPLTVFRKQINYCDIRSVEVGRTSVIDGWGIHWIPGRGSTYNLWGFDCATLDVNGKTIRVGSDDAENLVNFLAAQLRPADQIDRKETR